ncbi:MAG: hypothetical protein U0263_33470 [Polyangiaceae bacterium]
MRVMMVVASAVYLANEGYQKATLSSKDAFNFEMPLTVGGSPRS